MRGVVFGRYGERAPCHPSWDDDGHSAVWGRNSSVGSVLGSLSGLMQRRGFDPSRGRIFPVEGIPPPPPPKLFRMRVIAEV